MSRHHREGGDPFRPVVFLQKSAQILNPLPSGFVRSGIPGSTPQARPIARGFRGFRVSEKNDPISSRPPGGARGSAVDFRGAHPVHERAV